MLTRAQLLDPAVCQSCHPDQYSEWAGSMHAYSTKDPVFRAMNARGQRETDGGLGSFCVQSTRRWRSRRRRPPTG
ncbi:MAG TPA: multiheme c-type cytochrome, partial [Myxococcaceae bacterium]